MQYIDKNLLLLHRLHDYIYYDVKRKWAEVYEDEIRAIIANSYQLSAVPHLKAQLAPDRPLWEILSLVDLYNETLPAAEQNRDAGVIALVREVAPQLQTQEIGLLDFCSLHPTPDGKSARVVLPTRFAQKAHLVLQGLEMDGSLVLEEPIWWELTRRETGYRLSFLTEAFERLDLDFDGLQFQRAFYHAASCIGFTENPWLVLSGMAEAILEKHRVDAALLNQHEQALLPMLHALGNLEEDGEEERGEMCFAPLLEQLQEHNLTKAADALKKFSAAPAQKQEKYRQKLLVCLRQVACEPLWRQLYEAIMASQAGLPMAYADDPNLVHKRQAVTNTLQEMGFQGEYPFFWQEGPKKGLTLLQSYGQDYVVSGEQHGFYLVQALEAPVLGDPDIYFVVGTVFVKPKNYVSGMRPDIFSAMFEEKGRRCYQNVLTMFSDLTPTSAAIVAGKKARLEKLSKTERKALVQIPVWGILLLSLLMGVAFGLGFLLLFAPIVALVMLLAGEFGAFWQAPWLACFLFCTVAFGGAMAVIMLLQRRK